MTSTPPRNNAATPRARSASSAGTTTGKGTMWMFLTKDLQTIKQNAKKNQKLIETCNAGLALLEKNKDFLFAIESDQGNVAVHSEKLDVLVNKLIIPLHAACESRDYGIMCVALNSFQKLILYGYIRGSTTYVGSDAKEGQRLSEKVVEIIGSCFRKLKGEKDFPDVTVQLQVIKALLAAVVSAECGLHGDCLMSAIKSCYNIYLVSKDAMIYATAKASLDQMLGAVFQRLQTFEIINQPPQPQENGFAHEEEKGKKEPEKEKEKEDEKGNELEKEDEKEQEKGDEKGKEKEDKKPKEETAEPKESEPTNDSDGKGEGENDKTQSEIATSNGTVAPTAEETQTKEKGPFEEAAAEVNAANANGTSDSSKEDPQYRLAYDDCSTIFRALCKLSNKELDASSTADSMEMKSKILSLELLQTIMQNGQVFRKKEKFVNDVLRKYLCPSIGINGTSPNHRVFELSLSLFITLVLHFKDFLKEEIGVYFTKIFLKILESDNSTTLHKGMVLQALLQICNNAQTLLDIFVNYDCSLESSNVFGRMVDVLSKIAQGSTTPDQWTTPQQETSLKIMGLECLVTIMKSLVDWSKELYVNVDAPSEKAERTTSEEFVPTDTPPVPHSDHLKFEKKKMEKHLKQQLEIGKQKFNVNPDMGIKYFESVELLEHTPESVAKFLRDNADGLDKVQLGKYLCKGGKKYPFHKAVLHAFINLFDFTGLPMDLAIRKLLHTFLMGGEGEQVDMIMEAIAARYMECNPECEFATADAAYIFAYSIIMLATDLHSPSIPVKITLEQWMKNHKGINDGKDLSEALQAEVFARIAKTPLKLSDEDETTDYAGSLNPQSKDLRFLFESKQMARGVQSLLKRKQGDSKSSTYLTVESYEPVKEMFEICWYPMLAAFSVLLETSNESKIVDLCLMGFKCAIRVSSIFSMEVTRNAFITSLAKFTHLNNLKEIKHKNIASIKTLITIAHTEGNHLQSSWTDVLQCISKLEMMHLVGSTGMTDTNPFSHETPEPSPAPTPRPTPPAPAASSPFSGVMGTRLSLDFFGTSRPTSEPERAKAGQAQTYIANAETISKEIEGIALDRIFTDSVRLSSNAIVDFVECLCAVSWSEINEPHNPRMFSLQKLVEIAYYNMERIRIVWSRIWGVLGKHFVQVGCNENLSIAMYAIDSLRQLAMKFLAKDELANFHFQKDFLKPFELIINQNPSVQTRDMIIRCCSNMILARADNIKSGWKSIFAVLTTAATDNNEKIVRLAFELVVDIRTKHFELIADSFFVECVNCLVAFGKSQAYKDISLGAINSLIFCAGQLANGNVCKLKEDKESGNSVFVAEDTHIKYWFPILTGFSEIVSHPHIDVRTFALERLFDVFKDYGSMFDGSMWNLIFRGVILPIFVGVRNNATDKNKEEDEDWIATTCMHATQSLVGLLSHFFDRISFLLDEVLALLTSFVLQDSENLAEIGCTCLLLLVMKDGARFTEHMWNIICITLDHVLKNTTPVEVYAYVPPPKQPARGRRVSLREEKKDPKANATRNPKGGNTTPDKPTKPVGNEGGGEAQSQEEGKDTVATTPTEGEKTESTDETHRLGTALLQNSDEEEAALDGGRSPEELISIKLQRATPPKPSGFTSLPSVKAKCGVHLLLIQAVNEIFHEHFQFLSRKNIVTLLDSVTDSHSFAYTANNNLELRSNLSPTGVMNKIIKVEITAMSCCLRILFRLYANTQDHEINQLGEQRVIPCMKTLLQEFVDTALNFSSSYSQSKVGLVVQVIEAVTLFEDAQFSKHVPGIYHLLVALMVSDRREIRAALQHLFVRLGTRFGISEVELKLPPSSSAETLDYSRDNKPMNPK